MIELTIGEPDVPTPPTLIDAAAAAMQAGRTGYSNGRGEPGLRSALAERYTHRTGRAISADQVMCFPGTQTALFTVLMGLAEPGCEVLVGDPMYATYEGVIRASGADMVPVPLRPENGFRLAADDIAAHLGVTKDTVYTWIAEKAMPAHKVGRLWKFQASEIDDWVRRGGAAADSDPSPPG